MHIHSDERLGCFLSRFLQFLLIELVRTMYAMVEMPTGVLYKALYRAANFVRFYAFFLRICETG